MDLSQKTIEICEELSKDDMILKPMIIRATAFFPKAKYDTYFGFKPKKRWHLFRDPPIFKLEEKAPGIVILTNFEGNYTARLIEIANKNKFGYTLGEHSRFKAYF